MDDEEVIMDRLAHPWEMTNELAGLTLAWELGDCDSEVKIYGYMSQ